MAVFSTLCARDMDCCARPIEPDQSTSNGVTARLTAIPTHTRVDALATMASFPRPTTGPTPTSLAPLGRGPGEGTSRCPMPVPQSPDASTGTRHIVPSPPTAALAADLHLSVSLKRAEKRRDHSDAKAAGQEEV